jgi:hypothetical protein
MERQLDSDQLGAVAVRLALQFNRWIERRVETVSFVDDTTVRVRTSVTLEWPEPEFFGPDVQPSAKEVIYVPITLLGKLPMTKFDVERQDGSTFPILATRANAALATAGLTAAVWAQSEAKRDGQGLTDKSVQTLEAIVKAPASQAEALLTALDGGSELAKVLREPDELRGLTVDLASNFLLLAPAEYRPGEYEVLKYSYSRPLPWKRSVANFAARFGWRDFETGLRGLPLGLSESYHLQIEAPDEVVLSRARLSGAYVHAVSEDEEGEQGEQDADPCHVNVALDEDGDSPVVNLHGRRPSQRVLDAAAGFTARGRLRRRHEKPPALPDDPLKAARAVRPTKTERDDRGFAILRFRSRPAWTFVGALATSALATTLLLVARPRLAEMNGEAGSAILLALPLLASGYLGRPGEHAFATRLLVGVRVTALLVGVSALVVAGILAGGFVEDPLLGPPTVPDDVQRVADLATLSAVIATSVLLVGFLRTTLSPTSPRSRARTARDRTQGSRLLGRLP